MEFNPGEIQRSIQFFVEDITNQVLQDFAKEVKRTTPVDTGRCRRGWTEPTRFTLGKGDFVFSENKTPYTDILDNGYSRQAPSGMTRPAYRKLLQRRFVNRRSGRRKIV